jgi:F-type H+-transporting ATPase subunit a
MNISLAAEPIFHMGSFAVTNTLLMSWTIVLFLVILTVVFRKRVAAVPGGLQNIIEIIIENLLKFIESVTHSRGQAKKFFPLVATIFIFVVLSNWIEIVPGLGTIGIYEKHNGRQVLVPFIRSASADLNVTLAIAIVSVMAIQIFGIAALGLLKYGKKFINFKGPIEFFVGILELVSEAAKMVSFSFRLFGNIFAGEVLLTVILFLAPFIIPLPFLFLEIFVGFIQALVFSMLTLVFLQMATVSHDAHH